MDRARHPSESEESRAAVEAWGAGCREDEELEMGEGRKGLGGLHVVFIGLCGSGT